MSFTGICMDKECKNSKKPIYATYKAHFSHFYRKGREVLIKLALETGVSTQPYSEPTFILADKLVKFSKIRKEE